jgi:MoaA/NifB/PqqE/SkfB family radical SAM enzyme
LGINRFELMGGEPTMPAASTLFRSIARRFGDCFFSFCTNGTLIDETFLDSFAGMKNVGFSFSLDGPEPFTDRQRGEGTYARTIRALSLTLRKFGNAAVSITTRPSTWKEQLSLDFIGMLYGIGVFVVYTHLVVEKKEAGLPDLDRIDFMLHLQSLVKRFPIFMNEGYYGKLTPKGIVPRENHQIIVSPDGEIRPDRFDFTRGFGSLKHAALVDLLSNPELVAYKRESRREANSYLDAYRDDLKARGFRVFAPSFLY